MYDPTMLKLEVDVSIKGKYLNNVAYLELPRTCLHVPVLSESLEPLKLGEWGSSAWDVHRIKNARHIKAQELSQSIASQVYKEVMKILSGGDTFNGYTKQEDEEFFRTISDTK